VNSNSISFIPKSMTDDEQLELLNMCQNCNLSPNTVDASKYLEKDVEQAMKKIAEGSQYFKVI
jgi:hypothetical protein